jgi:uncharacterized membrane protein YgdD (TMEM256/DUF423 family)
MKRLLFVGALLGLLSVVMGALGDHSFDLSADARDSFATALRYNMLYAVLVSALSLAPAAWRLALPAGLFALGTVLFCFSIYAGTTSGVGQFYYVTPFGGLTLMAGWAALMYRAIKAPDGKAS